MIWQHCGQQYKYVCYNNGPMIHFILTFSNYSQHKQINAVIRSKNLHCWIRSTFLQKKRKLLNEMNSRENGSRSSLNDCFIMVSTLVHQSQFCEFKHKYSLLFPLWILFFNFVHYKDIYEMLKFGNFLVIQMRFL